MLVKGTEETNEQALRRLTMFEALVWFPNWIEWVMMLEGVGKEMIETQTLYFVEERVIG